MNLCLIKDINYIQYVSSKKKIICLLCFSDIACPSWFYVTSNHKFPIMTEALRRHADANLSDKNRLSLL